MIILKGKPKTFAVQRPLECHGNGVYLVTYISSPGKKYKYNACDVEFITKYELVDISVRIILRGDVILLDVKALWLFSGKNGQYWRIQHNDGSLREDIYSDLTILNNTLGLSIFSYLKQVASISNLRTEESDNSILQTYYEKIKFIWKDSVAARFLVDGKDAAKTLDFGSPKDDPLLFPYGCNASQKEAVTKALTNQVSIIQGPPGTGKTQTILNIIANIVYRGKSVLMVSNNNSAVLNVSDKLEKHGFGFIVAKLGNTENWDAFLRNQPDIPKEVSSWALVNDTPDELRAEIGNTSRELDNVYSLQEREAELRQERYDVDLEKQHFCQDEGVDFDVMKFKRVPSDRVLWLWAHLLQQAEDSLERKRNIFIRMKLWWLKFQCRRLWGLENSFDATDLTPLLRELHALYYHNRLLEIDEEQGLVRKQLESLDANALAKTLADKSLMLFKATLSKHYRNGRKNFQEVKDVLSRGKDFTAQYPVVLSTTFSCIRCLPENMLYDYVIMDEASQISLETGFLALMCAKNAVIVGDALQMPNVVTEKAKLEQIKRSFNIPDYFNAADHSLLRTACEAFADAPQTLLREHYRCHPRIIGFCNQKFYGGRLVVMTQDKGENDVLTATKTVEGNHAVEHRNQREIDVIKQEVLPSLKDCSDVGIITPYKNQVKEFSEQLPDVECATVHKYQGREKDAIILSVVDNQVSDFADNLNMVNVAVSRAKKRFHLVVSGNPQERNGNIQALLDYMAYNNCTVTESKVSSIFDYLYEQYTEKRLELLRGKKKVSEFDSENLTYDMISSILKEQYFDGYRVVCHTPLREIFRDTSLLNSDEKAYISHYETHVDFLVVDRVTHRPVLGVETDGYSYHREGTDQHSRDKKKDSIFEKYGLPLIRLSTKCSGEEKKVRDALKTVYPGADTLDGKGRKPDDDRNGRSVKLEVARLSSSDSIGKV